MNNPEKNRHTVKIIIVIPSFDVGGAEKQAFRFAKYVKTKDIGDVELFGFSNHGEISQFCEKWGIKWQIIPLPGSRFLPLRLFNIVRLIPVFRKSKPDIILSYTFVPNIICGLIWKWTGAKICIWNQRDEGIYHGSPTHHDNPLLEKWAIKNITGFISNSHHGTQYLINELKVKNKPIKVIPNGIELSEPKKGRKEWRESLNINQTTFIACMVANLSERKDHKTLLKSWKKVVDCFSDDNNKPVLILAGRKDETYNDLFDLAHENNIQKYVHFLGQVEDISGLLHSVDLCVHSSKLEGCSNGLLECMAKGLAVIATDIPANREALGMDNEYCLVPENDPDALAEKIIEFLKNENIRKKYSNINNNKKILEKFSIENSNEKTWDYLFSLYRFEN